MFNKLKNLFRPKLIETQGLPDIEPTQVYVHDLVVSQEEMYSWSLKDFKFRISNNYYPPVDEAGLTDLFHVATGLSESDWEMVKPKDEILGVDPLSQFWVRRAGVLNLLRLWWTEHEHLKRNHEPMHIQIVHSIGWED